LRTSKTKYENTTTKKWNPQNIHNYHRKSIAKLQSQGLDPETVTLAQLFPATLDDEGNDLSLMSGAEWEIMITYAKTRKFLLEEYPKATEEAKMLGHPW
jgi:hypothetical protein